MAYVGTQPSYLPGSRQLQPPTHNPADQHPNVPGEKLHVVDQHLEVLGEKLKLSITLEALSDSDIFIRFSLCLALCLPLSLSLSVSAFLSCLSFSFCLISFSPFSCGLTFFFRCSPLSPVHLPVPAIPNKNHRNGYQTRRNGYRNSTN